MFLFFHLRFVLFACSPLPLYHCYTIITKLINDKQTIINSKKKDFRSSDKEAVCVVPGSREKAPAGTTWIFSDGSQVSSCQAGGSADEGDEQDFFDHFERATQGENFRHPSIQEEPNIDISAITKKADDDDDDINAFMDQFERETGGENFRKA